MAGLFRSDRAKITVIVELPDGQTREVSDTVPCDWVDARARTGMLLWEFRRIVGKMLLNWDNMVRRNGG